MKQDSLDFYRSAGAMTTIPHELGLRDIPSGLDRQREVVQGVLLHRDWAPAYGVVGDAIRMDEQHLRSTAEILTRAMELAAEPITVSRPPVDRVLCICRHFALLHTALLRSNGVAARVRCGFSSYFDPGEVVRPLDHRAVERPAVGARRPPDR